MYLPGAISSVPFWCALMEHTTCSCTCTTPSLSPLFHRDPPDDSALAFAALATSRTSTSTAAMMYMTCDNPMPERTQRGGVPMLFGRFGYMLLERHPKQYGKTK